jgi:hypothetical protein
MKNALWFLYKPADEREKELFYHAYARSFNFLMGALITLVLALRWWSDVFRGFTSFGTLLVILIAVAYYLGWKTLKNEELTIQTQFSAHLPSLYIVCGVLGSVGVLYFASLYFFRDYRDLLVVIFTIIWAVVVRVVAWFSTDKLQLPTRIALVLALPFLTLLLSRTQGVKLSDRLFKVFGWLLIAVVISVAFLAIFLMQTRIVPVEVKVSETPYVTVSEFAPELNKGQYYTTIPYHSLPKRELVVGNFVLLQDGNLARIQRIETTKLFGIESKKFLVKITSTTEKVVGEKEVKDVVEPMTQYKEGIK